MSTIPDKYKFLEKIQVLPCMIAEGLKILGTHEIKGPDSSNVIMQLAREAGVENIYTNDDEPWCAVAQSGIALRCGQHLPFVSYDRLRARSFMKFGIAVAKDQAVLGDTMVFLMDENRYHVTNYIAQDTEAFHVLGGNQHDMYDFTRILKDKLVAARRPIYDVMPVSARKYFLTADGQLSDHAL